jgi:hypothetical protein
MDKNMYKFVRGIIAVSLVLGVVFLAQGQVAWASPAAGSDQSAFVENISALPLARRGHPGTVKPPPGKVTICRDGVYSVGGVATLKVFDLAKHYCIRALLLQHGYSFARIPEGAGRILADVTFVQVYYRGSAIGRLPAKDGNVVICYAVPPGKEAKIYYLEINWLASWRPLRTTVENGVACASARGSGAYALIGK